jgi:hypothetical protein
MLGREKRDTPPVCHGLRPCASIGARKARRAALAGSPSIAEPRPGEPDLKVRKLTRNRNPSKKRSRSARSAPAVDDNETLDHLLSVVTDKKEAKAILPDS